MLLVATYSLFYVFKKIKSVIFGDLSDIDVDMFIARELATRNWRFASLCVRTQRFTTNSHSASGWLQTILFTTNHREILRLEPKVCTTAYIVT